jgi:hypothetical protein
MAPKKNGTVVISASITKNDERLLGALQKRLDHTTTSETIRQAVRELAALKGVR